MILPTSVEKTWLLLLGAFSKGDNMIKKTFAFLILGLLAINIVSASESVYPLIDQTSFSFDKAGFQEFVYFANDTVRNMTYNDWAFEGIELVFENQTDIDWNQFTLVLFYNADRKPAPTPEENGNDMKDRDLVIFEKYWFRNPIGISYPFAVKYENGTLADDPNTFKLVLYYFGNQRVDIPVSIHMSFFTWTDADGITTAEPTPNPVPIRVAIFVFSISIMIFFRIRKKQS